MNRTATKKPRYSAGLVFSLAFLVTAVGGGSVQADDVSVGVAKVDVTPTGPIRLHGYLVRTTESTGVSNPIFAKAIAIGTDEEKPAILISVDSLGVSGEIVDEVAARLEEKVGLTRDRLALGASHTHYAPLLTGVAPNIFGQPIPADQQERIDAYTRDFVDKLEQVCLDALADRKPAALSWAQGQVGFAANRRTPGGPVDHSLPVLKATGPDGEVRAVVTNYACHCTTIDPSDNLVDGDWAGAAQRGIEADNPGCIALTVVGCGADSNPNPRRDQGLADAHGRSLADEVARLMEGPWTPLPGPPTTAFERFDLPYDELPTREDLEALIAAGGPPGYNASVQLERLERDGALPAALPYSAQAWKFGNDLLMVFLPGEVVVDYVLRLKNEFDPKRTWVSSYANDAPCYIPSERILKEGGYEGGGSMVYYARPTKFKPGLEQIILDAVHRLVGHGFEPPAEEPDADEVDRENPPPQTPEQALQSFQTKPGFRMELVAAEPLIQSPIAIDFGPDGKLWVCEMYDYPTGVDGDYKPGGRIKVLEDRDGDGRYDTATTFLDGLAFPTGVTCWRKGVLICASPEIIYAEDTDGDGKADVRKTLYEGFSTENYQARVNGLSYAPDGWVYGANGLIGGRIEGRADGREVDLGGRDFRFKPDLGVFEPAAGLTQQGRTRDDWGNQFGGNNSVLLQHFPLPEHYIRRNTKVPAPAPSVTPPGDADPGKLFPASYTLIRYNEPWNANRVTSACSPLILRDPLLGEEFVGDGFVCENVHNVVRRIELEPAGATFTGRRAEDEQDREFLASTDSWFRPVQVRTGPDGALWVVDMYRFVIEHPRWISPERLQTLDIRAGADMGRIYRLVPTDRPLRPVANLEALTTTELAAAIETPNGTVRDTVQRLLDHRQDHAAKPVLARIAREGNVPEARAQALAALDVLGDLDDDVLIAALGDAHPLVRKEALRTSETRLAHSTEIGRAAVALVNDEDARVRYQAALSLGEWNASEAGRALGALAVRDGGDPWIRAAILSSATPHARSILDLLIAGAGSQGPSPTLVEPLIATISGSDDPEAVRAALALVASATDASTWRFGAVAELLDASKDVELASHPSVVPMIVSAREIIADSEAPIEVRVAALRLLGRSEVERDVDRSAIADRLDPSEPSEIQSAALRALTRIGDSASAAAVIDRWERLSPAARSAALDALIARETSAEALVAAIEDGRIPASQIGAEPRERLLKTGEETLRERAVAAFGSLTIGERSDVVAAYAPAKTLKGDSNRGREVFQRACASCHKYDGVGSEVGPDLAALTDVSAEAILTAVLDPNREVDARYVSYNAALNDGRILSGLISNETASAITLKRQEGLTDVVLRDDLEEIASSGRSLMPEGLENDLTPADLADIIAYLGGAANRPKLQDGNTPVLVKAGENGVIRLTAASAEIYGPSLVFETEHGNLGYWHSPEDRAVWSFEVDHGTMFDVAIEYACDAASAGNRYTLSLGRQSFQGVVPATGGWSEFRRESLTHQVFHKAVHRIEMRPEEPLRGALADVSAIILTPAETAAKSTAAIEQREQEAPQSVQDAAALILDSKVSNEERTDLVAKFADQSAPLIAAMAEGLDGSDEEEEYRRIPWIWRVAIAAGRRNDAEEMKKILDVSLPAMTDVKLDDWRSVVVGGGLINGVSLEGVFPGGRFDEILHGDDALKARWDHSIKLAVVMADDEAVRNGTRYDALRFLGVEPWEKHGAHLVRYLAEGIDPELQQGAVSGLADVPSVKVVPPLIESLGRLTPAVRTFAFEALIRDESRREAVVDALEAGFIRPENLSDEVKEAIQDPAQTPSFERAKRILGTSTVSKPQAALLSFEALQARLDAPGLRILDARLQADFDQGHLPGAVQVEPKEVNALSSTSEGLADEEAWERWIAGLGITPETQVVVYDGNRQLDAARVWWLLTYLGVEEVALVDGGFSLWKREGRPTTTEVVQVDAVPFPVAFRKDRLATRADVLSELASKAAKIVDARSVAEHQGDVVHSKRGGRIPGACSVEWTRLVDVDGRFLPIEDLRETLLRSGVTDGEAVIAHCQGGGRASVNAFILERLGFPTRNYYHGWSDWGNADEVPVETGTL